nr:amino acid adenylation domain-containing protein [Pseudomonas sp. RIT-PI-AD]
MELHETGSALSPEQQACLAQEPGTTRPALAVVIRLDGTLDVARLQEALARVLESQRVLGSRFFRVPTYRGLRQASRLESRPWPLDIQDWRGQPDAWQAFLNKVETQRRAGFAVDGEWLARACLGRVSDDRHGFALVVADLISDRGGLQAFLAALRDAYEQDGAAEAEEEAPQYAHYVEWRAEMAQDEEARAGRDYWQAHLADSAPQPPHLPYRKASARGTAAFACLSMAVDDALADALRNCTGGIGKPLSLILQGAWWVLLGRIAGQSALRVGWRHDCRRDYEYFAGSLGLFEKSLPLTLGLPSEQGFRDWLESLEQCLENHSTWQEHWAVEAPPSDDHLRCGFVLEACPSGETVRGVSWSAVACEGGEAPFELALRVEDVADRAERLVVRYDVRRYDAAAMQVLLDQYRTLLLGLAGQADASLAELNLIGPAERARAQRLEGRETPLSGPALPERIAAWARQHPQRLALSDGNERLDYAGLDERVEVLARRLRHRGIAPGSVVALVLPRSVSLVVALLAVWRAGAAWVPLDPQWPDARKHLVIEAAGASLTLSDSVAWPGPADDRLMRLDEPVDAAALSACSFEATDLEQPAYLLFTSGTTGVPKGVVIEHRQLLNYVQASHAGLALADCQAFAMTSTVAADLGHTTLFGALFGGAHLHIASEEDVRDASCFARFLETHAIDCLKMVPSHLAALLDGESARLPATLILGGEAIPVGLLETVFRLAPDCRVFNHYGPTETTVGVLFHPLRSAGPAQEAVPLSQAFDNCRIRLLDAQGNLTPSGALGEVCIGGQQLFRGYLRETGAEVFVEDPLRPGERLYRSGDLGRYLPEGTLLLCGRKDHQVKIRGFRIELAEVEQTLLAGPDVAQAAVRTWQPGEVGDLQLIGYVQLRAAPPDADTPSRLERLRQALAERLPAALLPSQLFALAQMPRLANGKIDRQGLPDPESLMAAVEYVAPRDALETLLAEGMAQLLGVERVGIQQDFFALGGHSLLVIKLVSGLRKQLQLEVHPGVVFDHPSVAHLAAALRAGEATPGALERVAQMRLKLNSLTPEQREALLAKTRQGVDA